MGTSTRLWVASWVHANYRGPQATVKKDKWGFTIANFNRMIDFGKDSFALPVHVQQVFFSDCLEAQGWKVVIRIDPRGRRIVASTEDQGEGFIFRHGRDEEYEGLRAPVEIAEEPIEPLPRGRVIRVHDLYEVVEADTNAVFDRDIGESSDDG